MINSWSLWKNRLHTVSLSLLTKRKASLTNISTIFQVFLDRNEICENVMEAVRTGKSHMPNELKGKLLYLKLDCTTRLWTIYLRINASFVDKKWKPCTWTLALVDTKNKNGGSHIKDLVVTVWKPFLIASVEDEKKTSCSYAVSCGNFESLFLMLKALEDCSLETKQVICVVTDNAANMIQLESIFNEDLLKEEEERYRQWWEFWGWRFWRWWRRPPRRMMDLVLEEGAPWFCAHMRYAVHNL